MKLLSSLVIALTLLMAGASTAQETSAESAEWQAAITGQLEAFRSGDGAGALSFAGAAFRATFSDPDAFLTTIATTGYAPLVSSRSHSFGEYEMIGDGVVLQLVRLVAPDQSLYTAAYEMAREDEGWRVQGVQMVKTTGIGI